jgi:hypothetical protein
VTTVAIVAMNDMNVNFRFSIFTNHMYQNVNSLPAALCTRAIKALIPGALTGA